MRGTSIIPSLGMSKYTVLQELGVGGMGKVYKGLLIGQAGFQRPIVMKQLRNSQDPSHLQLFVDEARRYAVLDHENIGRIFDFERVNGEMCIILEYIDGWSLVEYLERHRALARTPDVAHHRLRPRLPRDSERRFGSAGEMGEACEHYLSDKGSGPTNLTLKQHLYVLFPSAALPADAGEALFASTPPSEPDPDRTPV